MAQSIQKTEFHSDAVYTSSSSSALGSFRGNVRSCLWHCAMLENISSLTIHHYPCSQGHRALIFPQSTSTETPKTTKQKPQASTSGPQDKNSSYTQLLFPDCHNPSAWVKRNVRPLSSKCHKGSNCWEVIYLQQKVYYQVEISNIIVLFGKKHFRKLLFCHQSCSIW